MGGWDSLVKSKTGIIRMLNMIILIVGAIGDNVTNYLFTSSLVEGSNKINSPSYMTVDIALGGGSLVVVILLLTLAEDDSGDIKHPGPNWLCEILMTFCYSCLSLVSFIMLAMYDYSGQVLTGVWVTTIALLLSFICWTIDFILLLKAKYC